MADLVRDEDGSSIAFGKLYTVYAEREKGAGRSRFMGQTAFFAALRRYCEIMKIEHAGSRLVNRRLGFAAATKTAEEAA